MIYNSMSLEGIVIWNSQGNSSWTDSQPVPSATAGYRSGVCLFFSF